MLTLAAGLGAMAFVISLLATWLARRWAAQLGLIDQPGHRKVHTKAIPRNGGMGIFAGLALPLLAGLIWLWLPISLPGFIHQYEIHRPGLRYHAPLAALLLLGSLAIHLLGLRDDRRAMAAWPKLICQLLIALALVFGGEWLEPGAFRVLTLLGSFPAPGFWLSALLSVLWIVALTNAFNFLDHMDGLSAGVAWIAAAMFLGAAIHGQQWFVAGLLVIFLGSVLGFLVFNFPPASIFMGDGGSMLLGFYLSVLTIRTTYYQSQSRWYSLLMPLIVMAVPLYDLVIVSLIRIARGQSPMVGDTNHFSHRLTRHGFSKRQAVMVIWAVSLACGLSAPLMALSQETGAALSAIQCLAILTVVGILERVGEHTS